VKKVSRYGFVQKVIILHLVAMLWIIIIAGFFFQTGVKNFAQTSEINKIKAISDTLAESLPTMIELGLSKEIEQEVNATFNRHKHLTVILVKERSFVRKYSKIDYDNDYFEVESDIKNSLQYEPIGKVTIRYSKTEYNEFLSKQLKALLFMVAVAIFFSIASSFYIRYMLRPLSLLATELVNIDVSEPSLKFQKDTGTSEFSIIRNSIISAFEKVKEYQNEIRNINANLENLVQERTIELSGAIEDLRQKDEMLVVQSRFSAMGEMIANIAHQWRQPLNIIKSSNSLVSFFKKTNKLTDEILQEQNKNIDRQVDYLSQTIEDFRNFYRDEEKIKFSLREAIEKSISLVHPSLDSNSIELHAVYEQDSFLLGSQSRLMQTIVNIINNAKDAINEKNSQRLILMTIGVSNDAPFVKISDSGGGISASALNRLFEPYFTTKHKSQGTGLGLYMSKLIVEKHFGAQISCVNESFKVDGNEYFGAAFTILFDHNSNQMQV
jgi:signal transduction histidine kinase